jgi:ABC-type phosphate transport system substrate-binding protein
MRRAAGLLVVVLLLGAAPTARAGEPVLVVIVHPSRTDTPTRGDVARMFLQRRRFWLDGTPIVPLNREPGSPEREAFSTRVLGAESGRFSAYWNTQYFQGVFPPTVLSSASAVKRYVATDPRAIGYVASAEVDASVRVVLTIESVDAAGAP